MRAGPDRRAIRADIGDRAGRADGGMHLERVPVRRVQHSGGARQSGVDVAGVHERLLRRRRVPDRVPERRHRGKWPWRLPCHLQGAGRLDGLLLALGDHANEVPLGHDLHDAGHSGDGRLVDAPEHGTDGGGPDDAAVQHPTHTHVLHVDVGARDLGRNVDAPDRFADDRIAARRLEWGVLRHSPLEPLPSDQPLV